MAEDLLAGLRPNEPGREAALLEQYPHLNQPGAGALNQIAGTLRQQLQRARVGRQAEPCSRTELHRWLVSLRHHAAVVQPVLQELLDEALSEAIAAGIAAALVSEQKTSCWTPAGSSGR